MFFIDTCLLFFILLVGNKVRIIHGLKETVFLFKIRGIINLLITGFSLLCLILILILDIHVQQLAINGRSIFTIGSKHISSLLKIYPLLLLQSLLIVSFSFDIPLQISPFDLLYLLLVFTFLLCENIILSILANYLR